MSHLFWLGEKMYPFLVPVIVVARKIIHNMCKNLFTFRPTNIRWIGPRPDHFQNRRVPVLPLKHGLVARSVLMAEVSAGRLRGRTRLGWMDGVKVALGSRGMTMETAQQCAKDRNE